MRLRDDDPVGQSIPHTHMTTSLDTKTIANRAVQAFIVARHDIAKGERIVLGHQAPLVKRWLANKYSHVAALPELLDNDSFMHKWLADAMFPFIDHIRRELLPAPDVHEDYEESSDGEEASSW